MSVGTYRVSDKKCATCNWWCGKRDVELRGGRPFYVKAEAGSAKCSVYRGEKRTPGSSCSNWRCWSSLSDALAWSAVKTVMKWFMS